MNIKRENKIEVRVGAQELLAALKARFPNEFILNSFPASMEGVKGEIIGSAGIKFTLVRTQEDAELNLRRLPAPEDDGA